MLQACRGDKEVVRAGDGDAFSIVGTARETLYGDKRNDTVFAGGGNDIIYCGGGDDVVSGDGGNDTIYAGTGSDMLTGGTGRDVFCFGVTKNVKAVVCDYESSDMIRFLSNAVFDRYSVSGSDVFLDYMGGTIQLSGAGDKLVTYQYKDGKDGFITKEVRFV